MNANDVPASHAGESDASPPKKSGGLVSIFSRGSAEDQAPKRWKPAALRAPVLVFTILLCWSLIAVVQVLLAMSQRNQGIIFAPRISDLPLSRTFLYLYFPTVVAVIFSMYWAWIDLETKRMEPYYQLSKENGALGKDSILLQYPFDFLPLVPIKAARDKHWPVFWGSFALVLVTWGLVPTQAGIFSTRSITRNVTLPFDRSTAFVPASEQASTLTLRFAQSTYGIAVLNETLTQYMGRNYTLAPFRPTPDPRSDKKAAPFGNWTAPTTMYSLDLYCEPAVMGFNPLLTGAIANSSNGCSFRMGLDGNLTVGLNDVQDNKPVLRNKEFTAMYVGYWNPLGFADYSLDQYCPETSNTTFYAAIQRNKAKDADPPQNVTAIYCWPTYYQQDVIATVDAVTLEPIKVDRVGEKEPLQKGIFNTILLEQLMSSNSVGNEVRGDLLPSKAMPKYFDPVARTNLSLSSGPKGAAVLQAMVGLALSVSNRPLEEYLDWKVLSKSYADGYRLMFARAMREVLDQDFRTVDRVVGQRVDTTEAVLVEPVFVYIVEGFLGAISLATIALLYLSVTRTKSLRSNPSTIAAIMSMVADSEPLLADIEGLDCCKAESIHDHLGQKRYKLLDNGTSISIVELRHSPEVISGDNSSTLPQRRNTVSDIAKPVRPTEFSFWVAGPLIGSFLGLVVALAVIFAKARLQGLPLPSSNTIVQNLLENYVPTAIATLIEPAWVLFNRLLCMLQPLEELQDCNARAKKSIDLDYSSLPPQLVVLKALKAKHFVLAAVCAMALLANLLAVSLAGLFNQTTTDMRNEMTMKPPYDLKFVPINGTIGPLGGQTFGAVQASGAYQGGDGEDQFLVADSYIRQGTPLPAWTDETMFYLPLFAEGANATSSIREVEGRTRAFGAKLVCNSLEFDENFQASLVTVVPSVEAVAPSVNITVTSDTGKSVQCTKTEAYMRQGPISTKEGNCVTGPSAAELVLVLGPTANASQAEAEVCMGSIVMGWLRNRNGSCGQIESRTLDKQNATFVHCRPRLMTGSATVRVDSSGRLQKKAQNVTLDDHVSAETFTNDPVNLIGQSNRYLFLTGTVAWHNDSFADGFINYFIRHSANTSRLIDPTQDVPAFGDIEGPLNKVYSLLFAIWMGTNKDKLLLANRVENASAPEGWRVEPETRLFVSTPMFIISEAILCTYAIVAIMVYMRRPGQYLARMPTSIASLIALFAASAAVLDMRGTSYLDKRGRAQHLKEVDARYGYGSFIGGGDGRVHIGIEKTPFVRVRSKATCFDKKAASWRWGSNV